MEIISREALEEILEKEIQKYEKLLNDAIDLQLNPTEISRRIVYLRVLRDNLTPHYVDIDPLYTQTKGELQPMCCANEPEPADKISDEAVEEQLRFVKEFCDGYEYCNKCPLYQEDEVRNCDYWYNIDTDEIEDIDNELREKIREDYEKINEMFNEHTYSLTEKGKVHCLYNDLNKLCKDTEYCRDCPLFNSDETKNCKWCDFSEKEISEEFENPIEMLEKQKQILEDCGKENAETASPKCEEPASKDKIVSDWVQEFLEWVESEGNLDDTKVTRITKENNEKPKIEKMTGAEFIERMKNGGYSNEQVKAIEENKVREARQMRLNALRKEFEEIRDRWKREGWTW